MHKQLLVPGALLSTPPQSLHISTLLGLLQADMFYSFLGPFITISSIPSNASQMHTLPLQSSSFVLYILSDFSKKIYLLTVSISSVCESDCGAGEQSRLASRLRPEAGAFYPQGLSNFPETSSELV